MMGDMTCNHSSTVLPGYNNITAFTLIHDSLQKTPVVGVYFSYLDFHLRTLTSCYVSPDLRSMLNVGIFLFPDYLHQIYVIHDVCMIQETFQMVVFHLNFV